MNRMPLTVIQSTHASLSSFEANGLLDRHRRLLHAYSEAFDVTVYSCDERNYSSILGVRHVPVPLLPKTFFLRHAVYYVWLAIVARRMHGVTKVFGSNIPTLGAVRRLSGAPMMVTFQWDYASQTRMNERRGIRFWLAPLLERLAVRPADLVLVTAPWLEDIVRARYGKPMVLLPNWADVPGLCAPAGSLADGPVVFAGRLHSSKGVDVLLKAMMMLRASGRKNELVIFGEGERRKELAKLASDLGLDGVEFCGAVPNAQVLETLGHASAFVLPTRTMEGHPKALAEAMVVGTACIATDVPGNRDLIDDGVSGLLVPPGDIAALAKAIDRVLDDRRLAQHLSDGAFETGASFSFERVTREEVRVLRELACAARS